MPRIEAGRKAPDFELMTDAMTPFRLSDHKDRPVVLFFYPEDDTEGCTIENREFTAEAAAFAELGAVVVGISPDSVESHCRFRDKYGLRLPLAADPQLKVIKKYGVWGPKKMFGHRYDGVLRTTCLVAPGGKVAAVWPVTRIRGHAAAVLAAVRELAR